MKIHEVNRGVFCAALTYAQTVSVRVSDATSKAHEIPQAGRFYLTEDTCSGFGVTPDGEFVGLFSLTPGRGDCLITTAVELGALRLSCFDGFLPDLYSRYGWTEIDREANWTVGEPDVVHMTLG